MLVRSRVAVGVAIAAFSRHATRRHPQRAAGSLSDASKASARPGRRWVFYAANATWMGAVGTLLYYWWGRGRGGKEANCSSGVSTAAHSESGAELERGADTKPGRRRFVGKVVLITGAAGDIGGATATAFAKEGAGLVLVDLPRTQTFLSERRTQLLEDGAGSVLVYTADVTQPDQVQGMVNFALKEGGAIDCFFNNAGIQGELAPIHIQSTHTFQKVLAVNVFGVFLGLKYVSLAMINSGGGVIVNTASLAGMLGPPNMAAYAASKHAVVGLTKTAARDLARHGIRVCAISPGLLEGKMWHSQVEGRAKCLKQLQRSSEGGGIGEGEELEVTEEEKRETERTMLAGTPMGRLGQLSEVASAVLFLCSEEASYLTSTVLPIDGGRLP